MKALEIDRLGLDNTDRRMLETIIRFYDGGPVGLDTLAATIGEEAVTSGRPAQITYLHQIRLIDILQGDGLLSNGSRCLLYTSYMDNRPVLP